MILRAVAALLLLAIAAACVQSWRLHNLQTSVAADRAQWVATELDRVKQVAELHDEINTQATRRTAGTRRDLSAAATAGDGLRDRAAAARAVGTAAATGCPSAAATIDLLADVPVRMDAAGRSIAEYADSLAIALDACQRAYAGRQVAP